MGNSCGIEYLIIKDKVKTTFFVYTHL